MPAVAVEGEVVATATAATALAGAPGAWTAGPVTETSYPALTVGGTPVIHQATCTFTFTDGNTAVTTPFVVTLTATPTPLQGGLSGVLRDGDSIVDTNGNRLAVQVAHAPVLNS